MGKNPIYGESPKIRAHVERCNQLILLRKLVRPERFELPTNWFEASCSIQLNYWRAVDSGLYRFLTPAKGLIGI